MRFLFDSARGKWDAPMRAWLRLTSLFGLPDEAGQTDHLVIDALGPILRADGQQIVETPLPAQFRELLNQLARRERNGRRRQQAMMRRRPSRDAGLNTAVMPTSAPNNSSPPVDTIAAAI